MFSYREGSLYTIIANSSVFINRTYRRKLGYEQIVVHTQWLIQTLSDGGANCVPRDSKFTTLCVLAYSIRQAKLNHQVHVSVYFVSLHFYYLVIIKAK